MYDESDELKGFKNVVGIDGTERRWPVSPAAQPRLWDSSSAAAAGKSTRILRGVSMHTRTITTVRASKLVVCFIAVQQPIINKKHAFPFTVSSLN